MKNLPTDTSIFQDIVEINYKGSDYRALRNPNKSVSIFEDSGEGFMHLTTGAGGRGRLTVAKTVKIIDAM